MLRLALTPKSGQSDFSSHSDAALACHASRLRITTPQVLVQVLVFAFLVVMGCTALMVPVLLYGFDLRHAGWRWQHAALFTAMIAGTDAVAVSAIIKGGPPTWYLLSDTNPSDQRHMHQKWRP